MTIITASSNSGKIKEIRQILCESEILSLKDIGFTDEIEENGSSFYENAWIKASYIFDRYIKIFPEAFFLADDSGLEIDALDGSPGIYSARYAGEKSTQTGLIEKVLHELESIPDDLRTARFVCSMILLTPQKNIFHSDGFCYGRIGMKPIGTNGFGYDPIFLVKESNYLKSMAELSDIEKNRISHRRKALDGIKEIITRKFL